MRLYSESLFKACSYANSYFYQLQFKLLLTKEIYKGYYSEGLPSYSTEQYRQCSIYIIFRTMNPTLCGKVGSCLLMTGSI